MIGARFVARTSEPDRWTRCAARALLSGLAVGAAFACSDTTATVQPNVVVDSAGVRIVVNSAPASAELWTIAPDPSLEIGADESDASQILYRVFGAARLDDGRIVIAQGSEPILRWFDAAGRYQIGTGRAGGGPGEFEGEYVSSLWPLDGDSVATWEHSPRRMQVFDPSGRFARSVVLELPPDMPASSYPQVIGRSNSGFVAFLNEYREPGAVGEVIRDPATYVWYRADGTFAGELARLPGFTRFTTVMRMPDGTERRGRGRPPFARIPVALPRGETLIYGSNDRYEVAVFDTAGVLVTSIRKSIPNRPVTEEMIDAYKTVTMARAPDDPAMRRNWEESIESAPYPDTLPAYRRLRIDRTGMLWIRDYDLPQATTTSWSVFDVGGRWVGEATMPVEWELLDIGEDYVLVLAEDELGVERVRRHALERR